MIERTYEMGVDDMPELIKMFEDGQFDELEEIIKNHAYIRSVDALSDYNRGMLDAWEKRYGSVEITNDHHR